VLCTAILEDVSSPAGQALSVWNGMTSSRTMSMVQERRVNAVYLMKWQREILESGQ
jgi:hypothetical protein